jgi:hypothetical protein
MLDLKELFKLEIKMFKNVGKYIIEVIGRSAL